VGTWAIKGNQNKVHFNKGGPLEVIKSNHLGNGIAPVVEYGAARRGGRHKDGQNIQGVTVGIGDRQVDDPFQTAVGPVSCKESKQNQKSRRSADGPASQIEWETHRAFTREIAVGHIPGPLRADCSDDVLNGPDARYGRVMQYG
jgi:hypothetical protein